MILICPSCLAKNRVPEEKLSIAPQCGQCHQPLIPLAPIELNEQNFATFIQNSDLPIFIDLWADWCGPCKMVGPIIEELAEMYEGQVLIGKCDVDENGDVAAEYGIRNIPTVLFFKNGELVDKQVGSASKSAFDDKIKKMLL